MNVVKELDFDKEVLKRIEMICRFACVKPTIRNGGIINIKGTNKVIKFERKKCCIM